MNHMAAALLVLSTSAASTSILPWHDAVDYHGEANQSVGVTIISDDEKVDVMARGLSARMGEDAARIAARLRAIRARGGPSLYVQLQHSAGPFAIEVQPDDRTAVFMPLRGQMMMGAVPEDADPRQSIVMFWVLNGQDGRYRLTVPSTYRHVTIVANGREIVNQPLDPAAGAQTYTVR